MNISLHPRHILWDTFGQLETFNPVWLEEIPHWEDYVASFFHANGLPYDSTQSNVQGCIAADDKAAFASMLDRLLPQLHERVDTRGIDVVMMAHWTPDLHLGTSVVNHVIHALDLDEQSFGLAISDRGLSAPLFALEALSRYIADTPRRALLLIADQKHLLYRSPLLASLDPANSACIVAINRDNSGWRYQGYRRRLAVTGASLAEHCAALRAEFGLASDCQLIASAALLDQLPEGGQHTPVDDRLLCTAPFATLQQNDLRRDQLILQHADDTLTAVAFRAPQEAL